MTEFTKPVLPGFSGIYPGGLTMILNKLAMIKSCKSVLIGIALVYPGNLFAGPYPGVGASLLSADDSFDEANPVDAFLRPASR